MMKIAIMGAMPEEITPILAELDTYDTKKYANNTYYLGRYHGHDLIIAYSKIGKVFSTLTATVMIEHFGAEVLLFSGVAGGGSADVQVGDIVVATQTVQHDIDITAFGRQKGEIPGSKVFIETCQRLTSKLKKAANTHGIALKEGVIATGDQFIHSKEVKEMIVKHFNAQAIEMEGASVNLVCHELNIPCVVLRAISDTADGQAVDDFPQFVEKAAKQSATLILSLVRLL
ncbi:5'-methylthioadenosine/adenosylhomocysteine nucleosidase [Cysteiniphilum sp. QT6929]|uniref:5'-methylthioadenosine/adenosylhomocysteine nucleosidase n=1 Tax=Cysteiniphilum sp. QT6929 TaxID=2975055 RepID=UPI0024B38C21|nr:5'-methylthioadenosine/adenosylhomocysteine nucleosidase [Cysteiniphilum sp. QT6929]WHN66683.1 5'-methylthioadenosine/adenosylhomocysteine nucleosidase [Cysteiniphilum sp. QT6929]